MTELHPTAEDAAIKPEKKKGRSPDPTRRYVRFASMPRIPLQPMSGSEARDALRTASNRQGDCIASSGVGRSATSWTRAPTYPYRGVRSARMPRRNALDADEARAV